MAPADLMAEHDAAAFRDVLAPLLDGSQPHILIDTKFRRRDPSAVPADVSLMLIRIGADRIVAIAHDITERKHTQLERELLYDREAIDAGSTHRRADGRFAKIDVLLDAVERICGVPEGAHRN
jgi:hypothetical protein